MRFIDSNKYVIVKVLMLAIILLYAIYTFDYDLFISRIYILSIVFFTAVMYYEIYVEEKHRWLK